MSSARTPNTLRKFIEDSPLLTLCVTAVAVGGIVYGALNFVFASKHEIAVDKIKIEAQRTEDGLRKQYGDKIRQLDDERSRIQFTVKDQSSFLDLKSVVVNEEQLGPDYRRFRSQGFAVPVSAAASVSWTWKDTNELDLLSELMGPSALKAVLSDPDGEKAYRDILAQTKVRTFESPIVVEVDVAGEKMKLRARSLFESLTKADLDSVAAVAQKSEKAKEPGKPEKDPKMTPVVSSMDAYYSVLFLNAYLGLLALGDSVSVKEVGLNTDYFFVKGSADLNESTGGKIRVHYVRICVRHDARFYIAGYLIPAGDDLQDVRTAMSMISGFKIIR